MQQVASSAEPAQKRGDGETIDAGETMRAGASACAVWNMGRVADVKAPKMQMREAPNNRGHAEDETDAEADEVEGVHGHCLPRLLGL